VIRGQCPRRSVFRLRICRCPRSRFNHARMKRTNMTEMTTCLQTAQEYHGRRVQTSGKEGYRVAAPKTATEAYHPTTTPVPLSSIARRPVCWALRASTPKCDTSGAGCTSLGRRLGLGCAEPLNHAGIDNQSGSSMPFKSRPTGSRFSSGISVLSLRHCAAQDPRFDSLCIGARAEFDNLNTEEDALN
jgi:hypothetical protein